MSDNCVLEHYHLDRMYVRNYCELMYIPSMFDPDVSYKDFEEGIKKAEEEFEKIVNDPEKMKEVIGVYYTFLKEKEKEEDV